MSAQAKKRTFLFQEFGGGKVMLIEAVSERQAWEKATKRVDPKWRRFGSLSTAVDNQVDELKCIELPASLARKLV